MISSADGHLSKARSLLEGARLVMAVPLPSLAAREAYLGAFHAALALIVHRSGRALRTHNGVHAEFARIAREEGSVPREMVRFLSIAYEYKSEADYNVAQAAPIGPDIACRAIAHAEELLTLVALLVGTPPHDPAAP